MTHEEMLGLLAPARLPADMAVMGWRELCGLAGLGLLAALILFALLLPCLTRRPSRRARIRATRGQPGPERILSVARILGHLPEALRPAAYGAVPPPSDGQIERIALRSKSPRGARQSGVGQSGTAQIGTVQIDGGSGSAGHSGVGHSGGAAQ